MDSKTQKLIKPMPELVGAEFLSEDKLINLTNLTEFLQANSLKLRWCSKDRWEIAILKSYQYQYYNQILRRLVLHEDDKNWSVVLHCFSDYDKYIIDDEFKNFMHDNIYRYRCDVNYGLVSGDDHRNCGAISNMNILGKTFERMCCNSQIRIVNPTDKALEYTKQLVLIAKKIVESGVAELKRKSPGRF